MYGKNQNMLVDIAVPYSDLLFGHNNHVRNNTSLAGMILILDRNDQKQDPNWPAGSPTRVCTF